MCSYEKCLKIAIFDFKHACLKALVIHKGNFEQNLRNKPLSELFTKLSTILSTFVSKMLVTLLIRVGGRYANFKRLLAEGFGDYPAGNGRN